jgi:2,4-dienoyl-CoA reductase-like NADH-dependent reductase (Old Yellow Enzyme family)
MSQLFAPILVSALELPNRIVMAPLGRARAHADTREPLPSVTTYYVQRASAGLIVSEATHLSEESVSRPGTSAIHSVDFIANPNLVERLRRDASWNTPDPSTFYSGGDAGYIDYPFLSS